MKKLLFTLTLVLAAMTAGAQNTTLQYEDQGDGTWLNTFSLPAAGSGRFFKLALEVD